MRCSWKRQATNVSHLRQQTLSQVREVDRKLQSSLAEVRDRGGKKEGAAGVGGTGASTSGGGGGGGASSQIRARTRPVSSVRVASGRVGVTMCCRP